MPKNRFINSALEWLTENDRSGKLVVDDKSFFETLAEDNKSDYSNKASSIGKWYSNKRMHFVLLMSSIVLMLGSFVYYTVAFLNDVILFKTEIHVNGQGALNPKKALNCEYAVYLFNTSEAWANTGVRINEGDEFRINISGGANTSITETLDAARANAKPRFSSVFYDNLDVIKGEPDSLLALCISKGGRDVGPDKAAVNFGSMLYTIQPEGANLVYSPQQVNKEDIYKWEPHYKGDYLVGAKSFCKAKVSGILYLSVNDLVFSEYNTGVYANLDAQFKAYNDVAKRRSDLELTDGVQDNLRNDGSYFYKDNLGQILVSVEIIRNSSFFSLNYPLLAYRDFEYASKDSGLFLGILYFLWFFIRVVAFYAIIMAVVWAVICLPYYIGYLLKKHKQATT